MFSCPLSHRMEQYIMDWWQ